MEDRSPYENVGTHSLNPQRVRNMKRGTSDNKMYMVPNAAQLDEENEYEELQISTAPISKKQSANKQRNHACQSADVGADDRVKKKRWCIVICMLITVFAVITLIALAVGALSLKGNFDVPTEESDSVNYTYIMDEISALKNLLVQLNTDTQRNISQLDDQLSSSASSLSTSVRGLSSSASLASSSVSQLSFTSCGHLSLSASQLSTSAYSLAVSYTAHLNSYSIWSISVHSVLNYDLSPSVSLLNYSSIYQLSTSVSSLSLSVSQLSTSSKSTDRDNSGRIKRRYADD